MAAAAAEREEVEPPSDSKLEDDRSDAPPIAEVFDKIGFGYGQVKVGLCGGGVWFADGTELLLISSVGDQVAEEWGMSASQKGFIVTAVYLGILIGNVSSGPLGDNLGRRLMILISYAGIFAFGWLSSYATGFGSLAGARIIVGGFIGLGQPAWNALGAEISPPAWRMATQACSQGLFPLGEIYAAVLLIMDNPELINLHWRDLLRLGALPALILLFFGGLFLRESPSFLALKGRNQEAHAVLKGFNRDNIWVSGGDEIDVAFQKPPPPPDAASRWEAAMSQVNVVFSRRMYPSTLNVMYSCFCLNLAYYGTLYAFPTVLAEVLTSSSAASELLVGALWEIVGIIIAFTVGLAMPRKTAIKTYLCLSVTSLILFCIGGSVDTDNFFMEAIVKLGYYGTKVFVSMGYIIVYQYATEIYPTPARITGSALNMAAGRIASMLAPLVYEWTAEATGSFLPFFLSIATCMTLNALAVDWLRYETSGVALSEHAEDEEDSPISDTPSGEKGKDL
mmetsp:Transcript_42120/g.111211  ORF Transcript_42120/g.111211 Transcript_42120/m.111211 type:complete len:508 (+) Transcript_42120:159-1682(+)|eukprot:CAMPEP_0115427636 /NCGR_PEP_ID=MMETSP0271-20121206/29555_1 /TAXON_ID=71861 /ORGANISM="Scrippsiella trochoidea, Strain CCMP3099" /LENGTH=507 /DNA_ID=CAMNT_0002852687 /DNA_START=101 /DNA_END=1624 /DNA_ORIENTATION=-